MQTLVVYFINSKDTLEDEIVPTSIKHKHRHVGYESIVSR